MKNILKLEELAQFAASILLLYGLDAPWWAYPIMLLAPDIGMLGYLVAADLGAVTYNLLHHKGVALLVAVTGMLTYVDWIFMLGVILYGHASMDRIFGYGLKFGDSFHHTHLGWIGGKEVASGKAEIGE
jgi:hypothetical protein